MFAPADKSRMTRSFGMIMLVLVLAIGGYLFAQQSKSEGPTAPAVQQAETRAQTAASATSFDAALPTVQAWYADNGTYAGLTLPPAYAVTVVRADASSYCLQSADGTSHENGPNGSPQSGPC
jgi:ABC-type transport system substrate-binding protein